MSKLARSMPHSTWKGPALVMMMELSLAGQETAAELGVGTTADVGAPLTEGTATEDGTATDDGTVTEDGMITEGGTAMEDAGRVGINELETGTDASLAPQTALFWLGAPRPFLR